MTKQYVNYQKKLMEMYLKYMPDKTKDAHYEMLDFYDWCYELKAVYKGQRKPKGYSGIEKIPDKDVYEFALSLEEWERKQCDGM